VRPVLRAFNEALSAAIAERQRSLAAEPNAPRDMVGALNYEAARWAPHDSDAQTAARGFTRRGVGLVMISHRFSFRLTILAG
jgi:hypothetical protein